MPAFDFAKLTTLQGRKDFHKYAGEQLRRKSFARIESEIHQAIVNIAHQSVEAALKALEQPTKLIGHENLVNFITETIAKHEFVTAIGIDLYGNDSSKDDVALEISVYNDTSFPFGTSSIGELQAIAETYSPWSGKFIECGYGLGLSALGNLRDIWLSLKHSTESDPSEKALSCLLEAAIYSRVHKCLHISLPSLGLPKAMPVIIGENDWGDAPQTVLYVDKVLHADETKSFSSQVKAPNLTLAQQVRSDLMERMWTIYEGVSQLPPKLLQTKVQRRAVKLLTNVIKSELKISEVDMPPNLFRMPREDFDQFMSLLARLYNLKANHAYSAFANLSNR